MKKIYKKNKIKNIKNIHQYISQILTICLSIFKFLNYSQYIFTIIMMTFEAKYLGSNGWLIKFEKANLLIDPWLTGNLVFPPGEWFFKGSLDNEIMINEEINMILLTQGLPDHCHIPSLMKFKKNIDIICSYSAKKNLERAGFTSIRVLKPSNMIKKHGLEIEATAGAPVPQIENGYIVKTMKITVSTSNLMNILMKT